MAKPTPDAALARLFTSKSIYPDWFAQIFLDKIPATAVSSLISEMTGSLGAYQKVEPNDHSFWVVFAKGRVPTRIHLDEDGKIDGLFFGPSELSARAIEETLADMRALPGKVSVLVTTDGKTDAAIDPDAELAVGSAFKLAILAALREEVDAKKLSFSQVVTLKPEHKSLPSGFLHTWPDGAPLTLHTLATLMISQSDNTATDTLIDLLGRAPIEKLAPGNAPFLTTREAFLLKAKANAGVLAKWRSAGEGERRRILEELRRAKLPDAKDFDDSPSAIDVEWRFSARRLCELLGKTKDLPMLHVSPGVASPKDWDVISYKGGSEPGVLNLSTLAERGGKARCVVATWNHDKPLDDALFRRLYGALLAAVRDR
jgi:beta-lactamase class A